MLDEIQNKDSIRCISKNLFKAFAVTNPILNTMTHKNSTINHYNQESLIPKYDTDTVNIVNTVKFLNNLIPYKMPLYEFVLSEIEGEEYYKPSGELLLIREYDSDTMRDYYVGKDKISVSQILEHDTYTGKLKAKIEPVARKSSTISTNIIIFDDDINNKYILIQITEDGIVSNITEFQGKSFKTLFRDVKTHKPVRYMEGNDSKNNVFEMLDCLLDKDCKIARIRHYSKNKEVDINYKDGKKIVTVNNKAN